MSMIVRDASLTVSYQFFAGNNRERLRAGLGGNYGSRLKSHNLP